MNPSHRPARPIPALLAGLALLAAIVLPARQAVAAGKTTLSVFAAASLLDAFDQIAKDFEKQNAGVDVRIQYAGSQVLAAQIEQGADADVFASADDRWMEYVADKGYLAADARTFATNSLVLVYPRNNPGRIMKLEDVARRGVRVIVGTDAVPVGAYTRQAIQQLSANPAFGDDFGRRVMQNVVSQEENVKSIVNKVVLGEADAGFVYRSDVTHNNARHASFLELPADVKVVARYPIAALKTRRTELANKFIDYVLSPDGQKTLAREKFLPTP